MEPVTFTLELGRSYRAAAGGGFILLVRREAPIGDRDYKTRNLIGAVLLAGAILAASFASNRALDVLGIANDEGVTIEQRKLRARERQWDWDHRHDRRSGEAVENYQAASTRKPEKMCSDPKALSLAKALINEQYPSVAKLGPMLTELEAARTDPNMFEKQWKNLEEEKRFHTSRLPNKDAVDELKQIEVRAAKLKEREDKAKERAAAPAPQQSFPDNEVVVSGQPYPIEYDRDLKRVACRVQYKVTGPATGPSTPSEATH